MRKARPLLGTIVEISGACGCGEEARTPGDAGAAIDAAFAAIEKVQKRMSFHDPESTLCRLNKLAFQEPVALDSWTWEVLCTAAELFRHTGGVFDVAVAPHLVSLGFLPPPGVAASKLSHSATFAAVELLPDRSVRFLHPHVMLDLGGIAKGFAVDQAIIALQAAGATQGLVNAGGDLRAFGPSPYPISLRDPSGPGKFFPPLPLRELALATSAHYFAERLVEGSTLGPIIDPATGKPACAAESVSVLAASAMVADALTKVVMVLGEKSLPILKSMNAEAMFIAKGESPRCTPGWYAALQLSP